MEIILKVFGAVFAIGGTIAAIVFGVDTKSFLTFLWIFLASLLEATLLFAFGEMLDEVKQIRSIAHHHYISTRKANGNSGTQEFSTPAANTNSTPINTPAGKPWICSFCGAKNDEQARVCKMCNAYRK